MDPKLRIRTGPFCLSHSYIHSRKENDVDDDDEEEDDVDSDTVSTVPTVVAAEGGMGLRLGRGLGIMTLGPTDGNLGIIRRF